MPKMTQTEAGRPAHESTGRERTLHVVNDPFDDTVIIPEEAHAGFPPDLGDVRKRYIEGSIYFVIKFVVGGAERNQYYALFRVADRWKIHLDYKSFNLSVDHGRACATDSYRLPMFSRSIELVQEEKIIIPSTVRLLQAQELLQFLGDGWYFEASELVFKRLKVRDYREHHASHQRRADRLDHVTYGVVEGRSKILDRFAEPLVDLAGDRILETQKVVEAAKSTRITLHENFIRIGFKMRSKQDVRISNLIVGPVEGLPRGVERL